jgi:hypothetical protein
MGLPDPAVRARGACDVAASAQQRSSGEVAAETALRCFPQRPPPRSQSAIVDVVGDTAHRQV